MGCNQTKSDDVRRDADRRRIQQQRAQQQQRQAAQQQSASTSQQQSGSQQLSPNAQKGPRSASTPIASPKAANNFDDENAGVHVGASYTDSRMEEHDYFKDIIDKAESRFIDVNDADGHARDRDNSNHSHHSAAAASASAVRPPSLVLAANPVAAGSLDVAYSLTKPSMPVPSERPRNVASILAAPPLATDAQRAQMQDWCSSLADAMRSVSIEDRGQLVVPWRTDVE